MRTKLSVTIFLAAIVLLTNCKKDSPIPEAARGEIVFGIYDYVSFRETFELIDGLGLKIKEAKNFRYSIGSSDYSMEEIKSLLDTKSYLTNGGEVYVIVSGPSGNQFHTTFFDIDDADAGDWFNTTNELDMQELENSNRWGLISVPLGEEAYWVEVLKTQSIIRYAELNYVGHPD